MIYFDGSEISACERTSHLVVSQVPVLRMRVIKNRT